MTFAQLSRVFRCLRQSVTVNLKFCSSDISVGIRSFRKNEIKKCVNVSAEKGTPQNHLYENCGVLSDAYWSRGFTFYDWFNGLRIYYCKLFTADHIFRNVSGICSRSIHVRHLRKYFVE